MKKRRYNIYGCLLLFCLTGMTLGICISYENSQKHLSYEEMSNVYGGCNEWYIAPNGKGCSDSDTSQCTIWNCSQAKTSCKQNQEKCVSVEDGYENCDNIDVPCWGIYFWMPCVPYHIYPDFYCEQQVSRREEKPCEGNKTGAVCWPA